MKSEEFFLFIGTIDLKDLKKGSPLDSEINYLHSLLENVVERKTRDGFESQIETAAHSNASEEAKVRRLNTIGKEIEGIIRIQIHRPKFGQSRRNMILKTLFEQSINELAGRNDACAQEIQRLFNVMEKEVERVLNERDMNAMAFIASYLSSMKKAAEERIYPTPEDRENTISLVESARAAIKRDMIFQTGIKRS